MKIHEARPDINPRRNRQIHYYSWRLQPSDCNDRCIWKAHSALKRTISQLYLIYIYRPLHPTIAEYAFFTSSRGMFCKIDHIQSHKIHLNKFKRVESMPSMFSDHTGTKLKINRTIAGAF